MQQQDEFIAMMNEPVTEAPNTAPAPGQAALGGNPFGTSVHWSLPSHRDEKDGNLSAGGRASLPASHVPAAVYCHPRGLKG